MALSSTTRGSGSHATTTTTWVITPASYPAAGSLLVLVAAYDNSGSGGADPYSSIADSKGNTWTSRHGTLRDPSTANAGCVLRIFTTRQDVGTLVSADTVTITLGTTTVAKAWALWEITAAGGSYADYLATETGAGGASTTPSVTTSSITSGDLVVGAVAFEYGAGATLTYDGDTSSGTWVNGQTAGTSGTTNGMSVIGETKVTTGTATQTYDPTSDTSSDWAAGWISVHENAGAVTGRGIGPRVILQAVNRASTY
jgi:hypothetical protein